MSGTEDDLDQVRDALFGQERAEIDALRERVDQLEAANQHLMDLIGVENKRAHTIGDALPQAVRSAEHPPGELGDALRPEIERAVHVSARSGDDALAVALYPVLGPAIRKMIVGMFPFGAEEAPAFEVEQVLLIERASGLLLAGAAADGVDLNDADMVSGMLDAIRMFVQDAFGATEHDGLSDLRVGETTVVIEWGPSAVLASVVRGIPTSDYRLRAATTLEQIHLDHGEALDDFDGEFEQFASSEPALHALRSAAVADMAKSSWPGIVITVILVAIICALVAFAIF